MVRFIVRDVIYGTGYPDDTFDVVHVQDIGLGVSHPSTQRWRLIRNYPKLLIECARVLKPGGYLVLLEVEYYVDYLATDESPEHRCPGMWQWVTSISIERQHPTDKLDICQSLDKYDDLINRQVFQAALHERGLDPFLGSRIQDYVAFVPGLEVGSFSRYCVPLTARHSGNYHIPLIQELTSRSDIVVPWWTVDSNLGLVWSIRKTVVTRSWTLWFWTIGDWKYKRGGGGGVVLVLWYWID